MTKIKSFIGNSVTLEAKASPTPEEFDVIMDEIKDALRLTGGRRVLQIHFTYNSDDLEIEITLAEEW